jgi:hypothetical protein
MEIENLIRSGELMESLGAAIEQLRAKHQPPSSQEQ